MVAKNTAAAVLLLLAVVSAAASSASELGTHNGEEVVLARASNLKLDQAKAKASAKEFHEVSLHGANVFRRRQSGTFSAPTSLTTVQKATVDVSFSVPSTETRSAQVDLVLMQYGTFDDTEIKNMSQGLTWAQLAGQGVRVSASQLASRSLLGRKGIGRL